MTRKFGEHPTDGKGLERVSAALKADSERSLAPLASLSIPGAYVMHWYCWLGLLVTVLVGCFGDPAPSDGGPEGPCHD